jgi:hypothetical protein
MRVRAFGGEFGQNQLGRPENRANALSARRLEVVIIFHQCKISRKS